MSGFDFHVTCTNCGLTSMTYPFRHAGSAAVPSLVLPSVDRAHHVFGAATIPSSERLAEPALAAAAAARSTPEVTVCVPHFANGAVTLQPDVACPRCGEPALEGRFGSVPTVVPVVAALSELVDRTRNLESGGAITLALAAPRATVICMRSDDGASYRWHVERIKGSQIEPIVTGLVALLVARGSSCSEPRTQRAFTRFDEQV